MPTLVRKLEPAKIVIFHCALSQQRGPSAAIRYARERERLIGMNCSYLTLSRPCVDWRGTVSSKSKKAETTAKADSATETTELVEGAEQLNTEPAKQKIYVLDRGFVGWQELYGEDPHLTEGYSKELWKDGY